MKVLHLNSGNLYGGVETFLKTLADFRDLVPTMQPEFGLCFNGRHADEVRASGCPVHMLGEVRFSRPWTVWRARRALQRVIRDHAIDVVVGHQPWIQALFGTVATRCGVTYAAYFHNPTGDGGWQERKARATTPNIVIAPSQFTLDSVTDWFPDAARAVIHNPLPKRLLETPVLSAEERVRKRTAMGAAANDVVILQASRVEEWKGPDLVVQSLVALKSVPGWQFWYAGAPQRPQELQLFDEMKRLVAEAGLQSRVHFLGSRTDVPELMQLADIYTQGNRGFEGFGIAFLEAAYSRVPIVTTVPGSIGEMVDATNGVIVPPRDGPALTAAFRTMIANPEQRRTLGDGGRAKAIRQCEPQQQLTRLAAVLAAPAAILQRSLARA